MALAHEVSHLQTGTSQLNTPFEKALHDLNTEITAAYVDGLVTAIRVAQDAIRVAQDDGSDRALKDLEDRVARLPAQVSRHGSVRFAADAYRDTLEKTLESTLHIDYDLHINQRGLEDAIRTGAVSRTDVDKVFVSAKAE